jgi:type II restriction enzyme
MTKTKVTATQIYTELKDNFKIQEQIGSVEIILGNISAKYKGRDAVGDLLQEWIGEWMKSKNYYFRTRQNTQEFPDFLLSESNTSDFLEIKTFNADAGPGFDLANLTSSSKPKK